MTYLTSTEMINLFDEAYPKIMKSTKDKSEYARLREAFFSGLLYYFKKLEWHDIKEEPIPLKIVWVRLVTKDYGIIHYATNVDDLDNIFTGGYEITHWQEIFTHTSEGEDGLYHIKK